MSHRIAIVGAGRMASAHADAWARIGLGEAIAYVLSPRKRPELAGAPRATWVTRFDDILADPRVDLISICTPTHTHAALAIAALEHDRSVLLEKPIALSLADAGSVEAAARRSQGVLMVAHVVRFMSDYQALAQRIADGAVGEPRTVFAQRLSAASSSTPWLADEQQSGGLLVDYTIHDFDQANLMLGDPVSVYAHRLPGTDFGTPLTTTVEYAGGGVAQVLSVADLPASFPFRSTLEVTGTLGTQTLTGARGDAFQAQARYFLHCVETATAPVLASTESAIAALRVALAARASLEQGIAVSLAP